MKQTKLAIIIAIRKILSDAAKERMLSRHPVKEKKVAKPDLFTLKEEAEQIGISSGREHSYSVHDGGKRFRFDGMNAEGQYKRGKTEPRYTDVRVDRRIARPWAFEE